MKKATKITIASASALAVATMAFAIPSQAHDRTGSQGSSSQHVEHAHATISATITSIPSTVTSAKDAHKGAYFTAYEVAATVTSAPAEPATGGKRIGIKPVTQSGTQSTISGTTLAGQLGFHADEAGTTKYALYPSDGSAAVLVTVVVDQEGAATVTSSRPLTVAYSADVAAQAPTKQGFGKHEGKGQGKGKGRGHKH